MLDPAQCRVRQRRLLEHLAAHRLDAVVIGWPPHVYYLSAFLTGWLHQSALVLLADGRTWLATANTPAQYTAADQVVSYEAQWFATQRQEQPAVVAALVAELLRGRGVRNVGTDASLVTSQLPLQYEAHFEPIDAILWQMRRVKDADELALMKRAIRCTEAMYARAKQIIEPGVPELTVFTELNKAAVETAGEPLTALLGNDFQCGTGGGPPRQGRVAKDGEIYILDLGPCYRGYFADNARAFAVNRKPTDVQMNAWRSIVGVHEIVQKLARPGARCRDIFNAVNEQVAMTHHLGHGVGLQPHEYPHLNPEWDDTLLEGEIFTAEPGIYSEELAGGIRLENQYRVTKDGVENLVNFPMELT